VTEECSQGSQEGTEACREGSQGTEV
jgi:hypothetical protein